MHYISASMQESTEKTRTPAKPGWAGEYHESVKLVSRGGVEKVAGLAQKARLCAVDLMDIGLARLRHPTCSDRVRAWVPETPW